MTIEDIAQKAFGLSYIEKTDIEKFCHEEQITRKAFYEIFARYIVSGYVDGRFPWLACDDVVNSLGGLMMSDVSNDYAWEVFLAFDVGECYPNEEMPNLTSDEVTRSYIDDIIADYPNK